jgi:hypothetical protein
MEIDLTEGRKGTRSVEKFFRIKGHFGCRLEILVGKNQ